MWDAREFVWELFVVGCVVAVIVVLWMVYCYIKVGEAMDEVEEKQKEREALDEDEGQAADDDSWRHAVPESYSARDNLIAAPVNNSFKLAAFTSVWRESKPVQTKEEPEQLRELFPRNEKGWSMKPSSNTDAQGELDWVESRV